MKKVGLFFLLIFMLLTRIEAQDNRSISLAYEYYNRGDRDKAFELFDRLAANPANVPFIHEKYLELLLGFDKLPQAEDYLKKQIKTQPDNHIYWIDLGTLYVQQDRRQETEKLFADLVESVKDDQNKSRFVATYLYNANFSTWAINTYLISREFLKSPRLYALDLATLYRLTNQKVKMAEEYVSFLSGNLNNISFVKDQLQNSLTEEEDMPKFRSWLISSLQQQPDNPVLADLLIWANIQMRDFNQAFIQARAFDRRFPDQPSKVYETGVIAYQNKNFKQAQRFFQFYVDEFAHKQNYLMARLYLIKSKEDVIKNTYPIEKLQLKSLMADYNQLLKEIGYNNISFEAMVNKAMIHAQYLNELDSAVYFLNQVISNPAASKLMVSKAKMALGDVYILTGEPWESALLYSQVEKAQKGENMGFEAKLKNATLSFYRGNFDLAKGHLDVLKEATTREIANDALSLSRLIKDNMDGDSTYSSLSMYAKADLHYFMNQQDEALGVLNQLLESKQHSLEDEARFLKAKILLERGEYDQAIAELDVIIENFSDLVLADDALHMKGRIYEEHLEDSFKAMEVYQQLLRDFPASFYAEDARKRFRALRGDSGFSS
jgi:predicted Zn-dependent protease